MRSSRRSPTMGSARLRSANTGERRLLRITSGPLQLMKYESEGRSVNIYSRGPSVRASTIEKMPSVIAVRVTAVFLPAA